MPRHVINRDDWDTFVRRIERDDDERIVAVHYVAEDQLEVLTVERFGRTEARVIG